MFSVIDCRFDFASLLFASIHGASSDQQIFEGMAQKSWCGGLILEHHE